MAFSIALSGLQAASSDLSVIGNNIANASTVGFKQSGTVFSDVYQASALGTTSTATGTGVRLSSVRQEFTQGQIEFTDNNLDLAINGLGFFILEDSSGTVYSRAGSFEIDSDGVITNADGRRLQGFQADSDGNIVGIQGNIQISTADFAPQATSTLSSTVNLDASDDVPPVQWSGTTNFGDASPAVNTYNNATSATIYDSLGNAHVMTTYFIKTDTPNQWHARVQVDGVDVDSSLPRANSFETTPASTLSTIGSLPALALGDLTISTPSGGTTTIGAGVVDANSPAGDQAASANAIAAAINAAAPPGITATANPAVLNLGNFVPGVFSGSMFSINGTNIVGTGTNTSTIRDTINAAGIAGITASVDNSNNVILTSDGRNIQINSDGTSNAASFTNFALNIAGNNGVVRGPVTISGTERITVGGSNPGNADLAAGANLAPWNLIFNSDGTLNTAASDTIRLEWNPLDAVGQANGSTTPQVFTIDFGSSTQFGSSFAVQGLNQNGFSTGRLSGLSVDQSGIIQGRYTNGQSVNLAQVVLANFSSVQNLQPVGDTNWGETFASGVAVVSPPGTSSNGTIQAGALEGSNVELTTELVALITTQRDFQANAKTIETADTATQTIINLR